MSNTKIKASQFHGVVGHGTDGYFLMTNADGSMSWSQASTGPSVTSVAYPGDDTAADPAGGQTVVLTGTGFAASGMTVTIGGTTAPSVAHDSNTQLTITTPAKAAGDYDIVVTNGVTGASGTFVNGISYNGVPTWTTAAGSLGTFESETTISTITLQATEPDGGTITFNITNGALPTGLSLTGANIDGTTTAESSTTLYSFTIEAIDDENQSTPRNFSITVNASAIVSSENFTINTYTGNGSTQAIEGKIGTAASFDGSSSYIETLRSEDFGSQTFTVSAWVNPSALNSYQAIVSTYESYPGDSSWSLRLSNANKLEFGYTKTGQVNESHFSTTTFATNTWYHVTAVKTSSSIALYVNGQEEVNTTASTILYKSTNPLLTIGKIGQLTVQYFNGKIDQVRIFNKALSTNNNGVNEINVLYTESNTSTTKSTTDIFDDGSGVALYEFEKGAIDTGGVSGKIGSGGIFNGSGDYITTPQVIDANSAFSISMWVNPIDVSGCMLYTNNITNGFAFGYDIDNTTQGLGVWKAGVGTLFTSGDDVIANTWQHIVLTYDGSGNWEIYKDGISIHTQTSASHTFASSTNSYIGRDVSTSFDYNGKLDQLRIFNKALSSSEVTTLYQEPSNLSTKSTADIFDDGSGIALYELEGNANDSGIIEITSVATYQLDGNANDASGTYNGTYNGTFVTGKFGQALDVGSSAPYGLLTGLTLNSNTVTYSMWCNFKDHTTAYFSLASNIGFDGSQYQYSRQTLVWNATANYFVQSTGNGSVWTDTNMTPTPSNAISQYHGVDAWVHIAAVYNNTNLKIYANGAEIVSATIPNVTYNTTSTVGFASYQYSARNEIIDQCRVFNEVLDSANIASLYNETASTVSSNITLDKTGTYNGTATNVSYAYDGTPTNVSFVGTSFQPDLVWVKSRNQSLYHFLIDSVRGDGLANSLSSNTTDGESFATEVVVNSFDSNGFTLNSDDGSGYFGWNESGDTYVAWSWKAADTTTTISAGTVGNTIASDVRANQDAGFSIVSYTGTGSSSTVGHGLSQEPDLLILKRRDGSGYTWSVFGNEGGLIVGTNLLTLNATNAITSNTVQVTSLNSNTFSLGTGLNANESGGTYIAYCFHSVDGYQKIGSYTGTGATGNVINVGFKPRFLLFKRTDSAGAWFILDGIRNTSDVWSARLEPHNSNAEAGPDAYTVTVSNIGFEMTGSFATLSASNASGGTYIYLAIA